MIIIIQEDLSTCYVENRLYSENSEARSKCSGCGINSKEMTTSKTKNWNRNKRYGSTVLVTDWERKVGVNKKEFYDGSRTQSFKMAFWNYLNHLPDKNSKDHTAGNKRGKRWIFPSLATHSVVHGPAALCALGDLLQIQSHGLDLKTTASESELPHNSADLGGHWKQRTELEVDPVTVTHMGHLGFLPLEHYRLQT